MSHRYAPRLTVVMQRLQVLVVTVINGPFKSWIGREFKHLTKQLDFFIQLLLYISEKDWFSLLIEHYFSFFGSFSKCVLGFG
jgi:hypothetical protein